MVVYLGQSSGRCPPLISNRLFSFGLLHRIPVVEPGSNTEELVTAHESTEADYEEQSLFVPADEHADTVFNNPDGMS